MQVALNKQPRLHRDFENDLPKTEGMVSRVALASLPFLSLYRPAERVISAGLNFSRLFCAGKDLDLSLSRVGDLAFSVAAVAGSVFFSRFGMVITTSHDIFLGARALITSDQKLLEMAKLTNNVAYMALLVYGSLQLQILSMGAQVLLNVGVSATEYKRGRYLEAGANLLMAGIRGRQLQGYVELWQRQSRLEAAIRNVFVGKMKEKWQFPSDHLPVGVEIDREFRVVSWNVMNTEYISWVETQGLNGSMLTQMNVPTGERGMTQRDASIVQLVEGLTRDEKMGMVALQECGEPFLKALKEKLPDNWHIARAFDCKVKDQEVVLYNDNYVSYDKSSSETPFDAYATAPGRPLSQQVFNRNSDGKQIRLFNAHIPGDPKLQGPEEYARYVARFSSPEAMSIALGDCNFERDRMTQAFEKAGLLEDHYPEEVFHTPWQTNIHPEGADFAPGALKSKGIDHVLVLNGTSRALEQEELPFGEGLRRTISYLQGQLSA